jgi:hypothetical protein
MLGQRSGAEEMKGARRSLNNICELGEPGFWTLILLQ